jgi:Ca2+-binding EF-hand superfamily protein
MAGSASLPSGFGGEDGNDIAHFYNPTLATTKSQDGMASSMARSWATMGKYGKPKRKKKPEPALPALGMPPGISNVAFVSKSADLSFTGGTSTSPSSRNNASVLELMSPSDTMTPQELKKLPVHEQASTLRDIRKKKKCGKCGSKNMKVRVLHQCRYCFGGNSHDEEPPVHVHNVATDATVSVFVFDQYKLKAAKKASILGGHVIVQRTRNRLDTRGYVLIMCRLAFQVWRGSGLAMCELAAAKERGAQSSSASDGEYMDDEDGSQEDDPLPVVSSGLATQLYGKLKRDGSRPGTACSPPGTAGSRPRTPGTRVGTPGTARSRPNTPGGRPRTPGTRTGTPGTARSRPNTGRPKTPATASSAHNPDQPSLKVVSNSGPFTCTTVYILGDQAGDQAGDNTASSLHPGTGVGNALPSLAGAGGHGKSTLLASAEALLRLVEARDALQGSIYSPIGGQIIPGGATTSAVAVAEQVLSTADRRALRARLLQEGSSEVDVSTVLTGSKDQLYALMRGLLTKGTPNGRESGLGNGVVFEPHVPAVQNPGQHRGQVDRVRFDVDAERLSAELEKARGDLKVKRPPNHLDSGSGVVGTANTGVVESNGADSPAKASTNLDVLLNSGAAQQGVDGDGDETGYQLDTRNKTDSDSDGEASQSSSPLRSKKTKRSGSVDFAEGKIRRRKGSALGDKGPARKKSALVAAVGRVAAGRFKRLANSAGQTNSSGGRKGSGLRRGSDQSVGLTDRSRSTRKGSALMLPAAIGEYVEMEQDPLEDAIAAFDAAAAAKARAVALGFTTRRSSNQMVNAERKFGANAPTYQRPWVSRQLYCILKERFMVESEDSEVTLDEFCYAFFLRKYGLPSLAMRNAAALLRNARHHQGKRGTQQERAASNIFMGFAQRKYRVTDLNWVTGIIQEAMGLDKAVVKAVSQPATAIPEVTAADETVSNVEFDQVDASGWRKLKEKRKRKTLGAVAAMAMAAKAAASKLPSRNVTSADEQKDVPQSPTVLPAESPQASASTPTNAELTSASTPTNTTERWVIFSDDEDKGENNFVSVANSIKIMHKRFPYVARQTKHEFRAKLESIQQIGPNPLWAYPAVPKLKGNKFSGTARVELFAFVHAMLQLLQDQHKRNLQFFQQVFVANDANGDGVLSFGEFSNLIGSLNPDCCVAERTEIFAQALALTHRERAEEKKKKVKELAKEKAKQAKQNKRDGSGTKFNTSGNSSPLRPRSKGCDDVSNGKRSSPKSPGVAAGTDTERETDFDEDEDIDDFDDEDSSDDDDAITAHAFAIVAERHGMDQLLHMDTKGELATALATFQKYDKDSSGTIGADEMKELCEDFAYHITDEQAMDKISSLSTSYSHKERPTLNFQEFSHWWNAAGRFEFLKQVEEEDWQEEVQHKHELHQHFNDGEANDGGKSEAVSEEVQQTPAGDNAKQGPLLGKVRFGPVTELVIDTGEIDTGEIDTGEIDTGEIDTGEIDTGEIDTGEIDIEIDTGEIDTEIDTGEIDTGEPPEITECMQQISPERETRVRFVPDPVSPDTEMPEIIAGVENADAEGAAEPAADSAAAGVVTAGLGSPEEASKNSKVRFEL